jgi:hypothetical protein
MLREGLSTTTAYFAIRVTAADSMTCGLSATTAYFAIGVSATDSMT